MSSHTFPDPGEPSAALPITQIHTSDSLGSGKRRRESESDVSVTDAENSSAEASSELRAVHLTHVDVHQDFWEVVEDEQRCCMCDTEGTLLQCPGCAVQACQTCKSSLAVSEKRSGPGRRNWRTAPRWFRTCGSDGMNGLGLYVRRWFLGERERFDTIISMIQVSLFGWSA